MNDNNRTLVLVQVLTRAIIAIIITAGGVWIVANEIEVPDTLLDRAWYLVAIFMGIDAIAKYRQLK